MTFHGADIPVQVIGLRKDYGARPVLRGVNVQLRAGQLVGLVGANGAGKTTLLGCIASLVRPTAGEVRWFGQSRLIPQRRTWIGMVSHQSRLYRQLTLRENLVFAARLYGMRDAHGLAERLLQQVGLQKHGGRWPGQVSRGMCQRVAITRAMLHEPSILLLDEPFSGLDTQGVEWLSEVLRQWKRLGRAICVVTHDTSKLTHLADTIWRLQTGRLQELEPHNTWQNQAAETSIKTRAA